MDYGAGFFSRLSGVAHVATSYYTFMVNGKSYYTGGSVGGFNPPARELSEGSTVQIVYDPRDPKVSCTCDPSTLVQSSTSYALSAATGVAALGIAAAVYWWFVHRRRPAAPPHAP